MKNFVKNDSGFVCAVCGRAVEPLKYSSRDHCPFCLCSLHVDVLPGDRQNSCLGVLVPIDVTQNAKKGYIIKYKCAKCGEFHNNKAAEDDNFSTLLKIMNKTYNVENFKKKK